MPEYVVAKPTQLNVIPDADKVRYDWKTRKFQVNPILDSLNKIPDANWNYIFEIQEISQILDSKILLKKYSLYNNTNILIFCMIFIISKQCISSI